MILETKPLIRFAIHCFWSCSLLYYHFCTQAPLHHSSPPATTSLHSFLANAGRKIHSIKGDGNCLFRSLSHQFLNTQDEHLFMRTTLVRFVNLNQSLFTNYLSPPATATTITEHIQRMLRPQTWGTHIEVIAAATFFHKPVYFTKARSNGAYQWECHNPLSGTGVHFPEITNPPDSQSVTPITHFELAYATNTHYDSIVLRETDRPSPECPSIEKRVIDLTHITL